MKEKLSFFTAFYIFIMCFLHVSVSHASENRVPVFVSILPQKYFVEKIAGSHVEVNVMVEPGANPHNYEPKPAQMTKLASSEIYFAIGINFEDVWLKKITSAAKKLKIVHTDQGIEKIAMNHEKGDEHGHDKEIIHDAEHDHDHGAFDPHIWLAPSLVKIQAESIKKALVELDPAHSPDYEKGFSSLMTEINELDSELKALFQKVSGRSFIVFHPSWGYFAREYGLEQVPVEIEGKQPKPAQMKELIKTAKKLGVKVVFAQPQLSAQSAEVIAREIGGTVVFADPLAGNWSENLKKTALKFVQELR